MLGDVARDALIESEFDDEYQTWLLGKVGRPRAAWLDFPARKLAVPVPLTLNVDASVQDVVDRMRARECSVALICSGRSVVGIFSERDLLRRVVAPDKDPRGTPIHEVMTVHPELLTADATLAQALRTLERGGFRQVPLVNDAGDPVSLLSVHAILRFVGETFPQEVLNAPPDSSPCQRDEEGA